MEIGDDNLVMEWKYDGVRYQAHYDTTTTKLLLRHGRKISAQYPDAKNGVAETMLKGKDATNYH